MSELDNAVIEEGVRLASAFDRAGLANWARSNPSEFYELIARAELGEFDDQTD
jgi:hypothetical protein